MDEHANRSGELLSGPEHPRLLGLLAEQATQTLRRNREDFTDSGAADVSSYLGAVTIDTIGIVQRIEIRNLLPETVRTLLFREPIGAES